jgi:hypothetical protein
MQLPERYRCYAVDCVRVARTADNTKDKALLLRMTETWNRLAEQAASKEQKSDRNRVLEPSPDLMTMYQDL